MLTDANRNTPTHFSGFHIKVVNFPVLWPIILQEWRRINGAMEDWKQLALNKNFMWNFFNLQEHQIQDCEKITCCKNYEHRNSYHLALSFDIAIASYVMKTLNNNQK